MRKLVIAFTFIEQDGNYLLQLRNGDPKIGAANLLGCFGGKLEPDETPENAICREISEETTLTITPNELETLGIVEVISDHRLETVAVTAHVFKILAGSQVVEAREGELVSVPVSEVVGRLNEMTPGTRAAFIKFIIGR